jgi:starch phosphorylase
MLRLRQQYFLVSAGLQSCMRGEKRRYGDLSHFAESYVFQLNDTHPILAIPEMMRLLMDEYGYGWDEAWAVVTHTIAYTNHTVMPEALERWPVQYVQQLLPRIYMIIEEINRRFNLYLTEKGIDGDKRYAMQIIKDGQIHMTNMAIYAGFSRQWRRQTPHPDPRDLHLQEFLRALPGEVQQQDQWRHPSPLAPL